MTQAQWAESARQALAVKSPNDCHGCGCCLQGGIVTPCSFCGDWGLFCSECQTSFNEGSCSTTRTRCTKGTNSMGRVRVVEQGAAPRDYFSASQVESFKDCPRKWAWRYINGIEAPPNQFASFGLKVHAQIEAYLKHGTPFDLTTEPGESAMAGLHFLPQPGTPGMTVEAQFILTAWSHRFLGYKDVQIDGSIPVVIDHKTTGNFRWAKTPEQLRTNVQAVLYAAHAMAHTSAEVCDLRWIYYKRTKPYQAKAVDVQVSRHDLEPGLAEIKTLADEMAQVKVSGKRALDLAPNPAACGAYGGCPYVNHCNLSPQEKLISVMSNQSPTEDLERRKAAFLASLGSPPPGAGVAINSPNQTPAANWGTPPPLPQAPPAQMTPPPLPPAPAPSPPVVDEQVLARARASHPNWNAGDQWWNGAVYIQPGDPAYPPVWVQSQQSAPPPLPTAAQNAEAEKGRGGRPKKNAEAIAHAQSALTMIGNGFLTLAQAVDKLF